MHYSHYKRIYVNSVYEKLHELHYRLCCFKINNATNRKIDTFSAMNWIENFKYALQYTTIYIVCKWFGIE